MRPRIRKPTPGRLLATRQFQAPQDSVPASSTVPAASVNVLGECIPPTASIWTQWGASIVEQYPQEEWSAQLLKIPELYRDFVRYRMIIQYGYEAEA